MKLFTVKLFRVRIGGISSTDRAQAFYSVGWEAGSSARRT